MPIIHITMLEGGDDETIEHVCGMWHVRYKNHWIFH